MTPRLAEPGELVSQGEPPAGLDAAAVLTALQPIAQALADADKHRSDNDVTRYKLYLDAWGPAARRAHLRWIALYGGGLILLLLVLGFAFYAYRRGDVVFAALVLDTLVSLAVGFLGGWGVGRQRGGRAQG